jgi:predicted nucleic acid-binding Zn ribbon protein
MFRRGVFVVVLAVLLAGCGHGSARPDDVISAGQLDIKLPPGWKVTTHGVSRPATPAGDVATAAATGGATEDTVPLAQEDPQTAFFKSGGDFMQCLKDRGTSFRGAPDQANPDSPTNDPAYIDDLSKCAAKTNIVQSMQDAQKAQDSMSPAEVKKQNKAYLRWRDCMIGRGWDIPKPKPDSKGRLFSFSGAAGGGGPQIVAPDGKDILTSGDLQECASQAQAK